MPKALHEYTGCCSLADSARSGTDALADLLANSTAALTCTWTRRPNWPASMAAAGHGRHGAVFARGVFCEPPGQGQFLAGPGRANILNTIAEGVGILRPDGTIRVGQRTAQEPTPHARAKPASSSRPWPRSTADYQRHWEQSDRPETIGPEIQPPASTPSHRRQ